MKSEQEMRAIRVQIRDEALRAIRQSQAFQVIAIIEGEPRIFRFAANVEQLGLIHEAYRRFRRTPIHIWQQP